MWDFVFSSDFVGILSGTVGDFIQAPCRFLGLLVEDVVAAGVGRVWISFLSGVVASLASLSPVTSLIICR